MERMENVRELSDLELLQRSRWKQQDAFAELVARYGSSVKGYAYRMLRCSETAEDVYVDTFERLLRKRDDWKAQGSVRSLIFTIAHNRCIDLLRKRKRQREALPHLVHIEQNRRVQPSPEGRAALNQLADALEIAIGRLPAAHREVLLLRTVHGFSGQDVAQMVGLDEGQVRSQLSYARKELRRHLAEMGYDERGKSGRKKGVMGS